MPENENPATPDGDVVAGVTDGAHTLLVADFADKESARQAYENLKSVEDGRSAAAVGAGGAAVGKLRERHHRKELATDLEDAIVQSAVDDVAADDIKAAAEDAPEEEK